MVLFCYYCGKCDEQLFKMVHELKTSPKKCRKFHSPSRYENSIPPNFKNKFKESQIMQRPTVILITRPVAVRVSSRPFFGRSGRLKASRCHFISQSEQIQES